MVDIVVCEAMAMGVCDVNEDGLNVAPDTG